MIKQYTGFDHENVLKPGTPIRITDSDSEFIYALIIKSNPLKLETVVVRDRKSVNETYMLDDVQSGKYTIEPLVYEEVK